MSERQQIACHAGQGEDVWAGEQFPPGFKGHAVEVGAADGTHISNTYALEQAGWEVLCIEPNPLYRDSLIRERKRVRMVAIDSKPGISSFTYEMTNPEAHSSLRPKMDHPAIPQGAMWRTIQVPVETLEQSLAAESWPKIDLLSIDTEGTELEVLKSLDLKKWLPKVIICEAWEEVNPIRPYLKSFGYSHIERRMHNDLYLRLNP